MNYTSTILLSALCVLFITSAPLQTNPWLDDVSKGRETVPLFKEYTTTESDGKKISELHVNTKGVFLVTCLVVLAAKAAETIADSLMPILRDYFPFIEWFSNGKEKQKKSPEIQESDKSKLEQMLKNMLQSK